MFPAFPHIRATRALAHSVKLERAHNPLEFLVIRSAEVLHPQPRGSRMDRRRWRGIVGQYGERGSHLLEFESYSTRHILLKQSPRRLKDSWTSTYRLLWALIGKSPLRRVSGHPLHFAGRILGFVYRHPADIGNPALIDSTLYQIVHIVGNAFVVHLQHGKNISARNYRN